MKPVRKDGAASLDAARRRLFDDLGHAGAFRTIRYRSRAEIDHAADRLDGQGAEQ